MKCRNLIVLLLVSILYVNSFAIILDDFEDGDRTNDPAWLIDADWGTDEVVADPYRPGNLAYRSHGSATAHRSVYALLPDGTMSWNGFDWQYEFLADAQDYHFSIGLRGGIGSASITSVLHYRTGWSNVSMALMQAGGTESKSLAPSVIPTDSWMKMHIWHDTTDNMLHQEIRVLDTDALIASISTPAIDDFANTEINRMFMSIERTGWQYMDNITLVPEPATLLLLGLGGLALRIRK